VPRSGNGTRIGSVLLRAPDHERESKIDDQGRDDQERDKTAREDHEYLSSVI
jgi:hypothetical protein